MPICSSKLIKVLCRNRTSWLHFLCLAFLVRNIFTFNKDFLRILFLFRFHFYISSHSNTCTNRQRVTNIQNEQTLQTEQPSTTLRTSTSRRVWKNIFVAIPLAVSLIPKSQQKRYYFSYQLLHVLLFCAGQIRKLAIA